MANSSTAEELAQQARFVTGTLAITCLAVLQSVYYHQVMYYPTTKSAAMAIPVGCWKNSTAAIAQAEP